MLHGFRCISLSLQLLFLPSGFHSEFKQVISRMITEGERASIKKMQAFVCVYVHMCLFMSNV